MSAHAEANALPSPFRLDGMVAVITGASQNIGAATARLFAAAGCNLVLTARKLEPLTVVADEIRSTSSVQVLALASDITNGADRAELVRKSLETFGKVDILVNNAYAGSSFLRDDGGKTAASLGTIDQDLDVWEAGFQGNVLGPCDLVRGFAPGMIEAGSGSIINVLSTAAFKPVHGQGAYGVTKAAMGMMTRYLAQDLGPAIRVNAFCPGTIFEPGAPVSERRRNVLSSIPLGRFGVADECAAAALYLASPASSFTTGQTIFVDGGNINVGMTGRTVRPAA
ncbi:SDR family NAD(P)-dependent oxidoreductase [Sphingobium subterraneum]|uniref:7-alpha-hydroxysteroid dehydrogenase n=1 Tax=Sphingobium subterraneum TaxID=627688 RepID=A0A841J568_9SPHN|nr:SDR family oxidoreductase [Sphingobium subterraneum]MBB6123371.1 7-alpha-hydroxysteroid dehydrogenase [Sphingobium subterraneum]